MTKIMDFETYLKTINVVDVAVEINPASTGSVDKAIDICQGYANRLADVYPTLNVRMTLTDLRNGNQYRVYSHDMADRYDMESTAQLVLDMEAIGQAIAQSQPDAIAAIVRAELAKLVEVSPDAQAVADRLKMDAEFVASLRPSVMQQVALSLKKRRVSLSLRKHSVNLSLIRRRVQLDIEVVAHAA